MLLWTPRILGIAMSLFLSLFALDAFDPERTVVRSLPAFGVHLIPSVALLALVWFAFRWPLVGTFGFVALAIGYAYWAREHLSWILAISWPLLVIGALFLLSWLFRERSAAA